MAEPHADFKCVGKPVVNVSTRHPARQQGRQHVRRHEGAAAQIRPSMQDCRRCRFGLLSKVMSLEGVGLGPAVGHNVAVKAPLICKRFRKKRHNAAAKARFDKRITTIKHAPEEREPHPSMRISSKMMQMIASCGSSFQNQRKLACQSLKKALRERIQ
eukprot:4507487-Pleurochrysis_carterae.AAC.1